MIKKLLAFACCTMWFGVADAAVIEIDPATNPGSNEMGTFSVPVGDYARVVSGNGLVLGNGGMSVGSLYVGMDSTAPASPTGEVFIEQTAGNNYTIRSDGNISVTDWLEVLTGHSLGIGAKTQGGTINTVSIGSIAATGALAMENVGTLSVGSITSNNTLNLSANNITTTGAINSVAGNTTLNVSNALNVGGAFITDGNATTEINTGTMSVGAFQNESGSVTIVSGGAITSAGNFENSGTLLDITGGNMTVTGTMKNDSNSGTTRLNLTSLAVNGGLGINLIKTLAIYIQV